MPSARRLASLVALVAPLVSSSGCVCPRASGGLFQCYHQATEGTASDSETTETGATDTTDMTMGTHSSMSMSQSETMEPICNMNARCDDGESVVLCPDECKACGNGELDEGEVCDEGKANSPDNAYHDGSPETAPCNSSCTGSVPLCGDGTCQMEHENMINYAQDGCMPACGNGAVEAGEDCDDGNLENTDACLNNCKAASCGDGFIAAGVEECDDTNLSGNDACTNACKMATCGDGLTWTGTEDCDDANADDTDACDVACKTVVHRKVFVSSLQFNGNLGGLIGADTRCQALAAGAGLTGNFQAWLSDATKGPIDRFDTGFTGVYELVDGTLVAHGWTDLVDGTPLESAINKTEKSAVIVAFTWSNTDADGGVLAGGEHCVSWTSMADDLFGARGRAKIDVLNFGWTNTENTECINPLNLYCFEAAPP